MRYRRKDAEAARILFLGNASVFDAMIGCFDAKYHYWFIRPPQADPLIVTPFPTPAHPSYPSAHSCISGGMTETLARAFPSERDRLEAVARRRASRGCTPASTIASTWWRDSPSAARSRRRPGG